MSVNIPPEWKILLVFGLVYISITSSRVQSEVNPCKDFQCKSGFCIPLIWLCDGEEDCLNGEDEFTDNEQCRMHKKTNGLTSGRDVKGFSCLPNHYLCPGTMHCIPMKKVCDGVTDCLADRADEGAHCANRGCRFKRCQMGCQETLRGPTCYCPDGMKPKAGKETECEDMDECSYDGFCDQKCNNTHGNYECSCNEGYKLIDSKRCEAINVPPTEKPTLLFTSSMNVQHVMMNGDEISNSSFSPTGYQIEAMDFNHRNGSYCWITSFTNKNTQQLKCARINGSEDDMWVIDTEYKLKGIVDIAYDWIGKNWYFAYKNRGTIFLCTEDGKRCQTVNHYGKGRKVRSLAVDPTKGYLFHSDSISHIIYRMTMEGKEPLTLVYKKIVYPAALALDYANEHVYWSDTFYESLERVSYHGENRNIIFYGIQVKHVYGITIFENSIYLAYHYLGTIAKFDRFNQSYIPETIKENLHDPTSIHVYHRQRQPDLKANVPDCEHIAVSVPFKQKAKLKCLCQPGYSITNATKCTKIEQSQFLIYTNAEEGTIVGASMQPDYPNYVMKPIQGLLRPAALDYDPRSGYIYYSDIAQRLIGRYHINSGTNTENFIDVTHGTITCAGLAVDWVGNNLFWTDQRLQTINVIRLDKKESWKVLPVNTTHPKAIVVDPLEGYIYWTDWVYHPRDPAASATIQRAEMDGSNQITFVPKEIIFPTGLFLDITNKELYWADSSFNQIEKISLNGSKKPVKVLTSDKNYLVQHPYDLVVFNRILYYTASGTFNSYHLDTHEHLTLRNNSILSHDLALFTKKIPPGSNKCSKNNGGCSDLCLALPNDDYVCACPEGKELVDKVCQSIKEYKQPEKCSAQDEFACSNGQCITNLWVCDGDNDCEDNSDENSTYAKRDCGTVSCGSMIMCNNHKCIPPQWMCDGEKDCPDGGDEAPENCNRSRECPPDHRMCGGVGRCIPTSWWCDHDQDCSGGEDEDDNCSYSTCKPDYFQCTNRRCIPYDHRCDRENDCPDGSDEMNCKYQCDPGREFKCKNSSLCFPLIFRCDGEANCPDASDELGCNNTRHDCLSNQFTCRDGFCIPDVWKCDGELDCDDGSDESDCSEGGCSERQFNCGKHQCIPQDWVCDGTNDCTDHSDEKHCPHHTPCNYPSRTCKNDSLVCLTPEKLCDGQFDCSDGSDEGGFCDLDMCDAHDCSHNCTPAPNGYICLCPSHKKLLPDNKTCAEIDICEQWGICSQNCTSGPQKTYQCTCFDGYTMDIDRKACIPNDNVTTYLLFSNQHEVRRMEIKSKVTISLLSGLRSTIALDFHYEKNMIFWSDVVDEVIYSGQLESDSILNTKAIVNIGLRSTEGLAIDWIGNNMYWVESRMDQIEVARLDGSMRTSLLAGNINSPRAIVLDPREGALFWTDWDDDLPRIETCSMSGKDRQTIINITSLGGGWPNGLTVDYDFKRLYWVDARSDSLHTITYGGKDLRMVLKNHSHLAHPFAITLFGDFLYWTDWKSNHVVSANKFNGTNATVIHKTETQPFDIHVLHPKRQPWARNPCENNNGGCSHLCLLNHGGTSSCHCPYLTKLKSDNKTCEEILNFLLFTSVGVVLGVQLEDAHYNVMPAITAPHVDTPSVVDFDLSTQQIYWTDKVRNVISSANLTNMGSHSVIISGLENPEGFAIDWLSGNMYFTSYGVSFGTISVARLNGAFRTVLIQHDLEKPRALALHPVMGKMFWLDGKNSQTKIMTATMDGREIKTVLAEANITTFAIDRKLNRIYYVTHEAIKSTNFDVTNITTMELKSLVNPSHTGPAYLKNSLVQKLFNFTKGKSSRNPPRTITVFEDYIYFASETIIGKISISEGKVEILRNNRRNVFSLVVHTKAEKTGQNGCTSNNGNCPQLCLPQNETSRRCVCTAGYQLKDNKCIGIRTFLMYSVSSEIRGIPLDINSSNVKALPTIPRITMATAIDFYAKDDYIYWVDITARTISRIKRDLTGRETIVPKGETIDAQNTVNGLNSVEGLAVDWVAGNVYWTDSGYSTIEVARLDGEHRYVLIFNGLDQPRSIVVHPMKGYMFWADSGAHPAIERARLDGSERTVLLNKSIAMPHGLSIDYETDRLYWCDKKLGTIGWISINGSESHTIAHTMQCMSLTVYKEHIYWVDSANHSGSIIRANKNDGSDLIYLKTNLGSKLKDIKVFHSSNKDDQNVCSGNTTGCQNLCLLSAENKATCTCSYGQLDEDGKSCKDYDAYLLFSEVTSIRGIHMINENNLNPPVRPMQNRTYMKNVIGLSFDYKRQRIFYSDIQRSEIGSISLNGSHFKILARNVGSAEGLAYSSELDYLYWTSYTHSSISRLNVNDTVVDPQPETILELTNDDYLRAIVINSCESRMYWTNWNIKNPSIQRASLNGYDAHYIITTNIHTPNGLTIDHKAQKLYWADARLDKIERCNLDGTGRMVIVTAVPRHSFALAVYGNFIYWTDWMLKAVLRANKYDGSGITWMRNRISRHPMGIIAVANDTDDCKQNPCYQNRFGCHDMCQVDTHGNPFCSCRDGFSLMSDMKTCTKNGTCGLNKFVCLSSHACIPYEKTCDNISDCIDASDEDKGFCQHRECPVTLFDCINKKCIPYNQVCDGHDDCGDSSDEVNCKCESDQFRCKNGLCLPNELKCNRKDDCGDNSDEALCTDHEYCGENQFFCRSSNYCIDNSQKCDGRHDCQNGEDEQNCNRAKCNEQDEFLCEQNNMCIPKMWRCDLSDDCPDGSDETNCSCNPELFKCADGTCLPSNWECDGHSDCQDGSDEYPGCSNSTCEPPKFACVSNGHCIPNQWKCDGQVDCQDSSDESQENGCPPTVCRMVEFQCKNKVCIDALYVCDHDNDCTDGSDEAPYTLCNYKVCANPESEFMCVSSNECIDISHRCDSIEDCDDGSDEVNCTKPDECEPPSHFLCHNNVCINQTLVCNGRNDCGDRSDEPSSCGVDQCQPPRPCEHICTNLGYKYKCSCHPGFKLVNDKFCEDIDECKESFPCSHMCNNTVGSFFCSCAEGYVLESDKRYCKVAQEPPPKLLVASRYYIREMDFNGENMQLVTDGVENVVAIDYDWVDHYIYWSDITPLQSKISRARMNTTDYKVLHHTNVKDPDGIAVDWIGRNLYWCDRTTDTIEVSQLNGNHRRILLKDGLQEPRAIEVYPAKGLLFYTDWGHLPHIGRVDMNGQNRMNLIEEELIWPNALTVDYVTDKIFWADGRLKYIAMADLDGRNQRKIITKELYHIFAIATFEGYIFWTDWETKRIHRAKKFVGENITNFLPLSYRPMDIQVFHPFRQPQLDDPSKNPCYNNGNCSHLCLLSPDPKNGIGRVCDCSNGYYLAHDNMQCIQECSIFEIGCKSDFRCIPYWWKCDNHSDCEDGSDEPEDCSEHPYYCKQSGMFQCSNASSSADCIYPMNICDGVEDCQDGSDESLCDTYECLEDQFKCATSLKCIPKSMVCDGHFQCVSGEDERNCYTVTCNPNQFKCWNDKCIELHWQCDSGNDCGDFSDELNCSNFTCKEDYFQCARSKTCIPKNWVCDERVDCPEMDDSDEQHCNLRTCGPDMFSCGGSSCIKRSWVCDNYDDCKGGSDEENCHTECPPDTFKCDNGSCKDLSSVCDGMPDCLDNSDETNCNISTIVNTFACKSSKAYISKEWVCDGDIDCVDGSDEQNCACQEGQWKCQDGGCIANFWRCDGAKDCNDNSDEDLSLCANHSSCLSTYFQCLDNICIPKSSVCDGTADCPDKSDEINCTYSTTKNRHQCRFNDFKCSDSTICIPMSRVCDNVLDCPDNSDEDPNICYTKRPCADGTKKNGGCEMQCVQFSVGYKCVCPEGTKLADDDYSCEDIDECSLYRSCPQKCTNFYGGFNCSCEDNFFEQRIDGATVCHAKGDPVYLLIAEENTLHISSPQKNIMKLNVWNNEMRERIKSIQVDIEYLTVFMLLANNITKMKLPTVHVRHPRSTNSTVHPTVLNFGVPLRPKDIALNWIEKHIYWTDEAIQGIRMSNYNGTFMRSIIKHKVANPFAISVDPIHKKVFWTNRGPYSKIESSNLDGSNHTVLAEINVGWPSGLTVDIPNKRIYWADTKTKTIGTVDIYGNDRQQAAKFLQASGGPYKIDVFENQLYITMSEKHNVLTADKFGKQKAKNILNKGMLFVGDIVAVQKYKQKIVPSQCKPNTCKPYELCTVIPSFGPVCNCSDSHLMRNKTCSPRPISRCESDSDCQNNGTCENYKCICNPAYNGTLCENKRCKNFCMNGNCIDPTSSNQEPTCSCNAGYEGVRCNHYMCTNYCFNRGRCSIKDNKQQCDCPPNYKGSRCEIHRQDDWCASYCHNNGTCSVGNFHAIKCDCQKGFKGRRCEQCENKMCPNNSMCTRDNQGLFQCINKVKQWVVKCQKHCPGALVCYYIHGKPACHCPGRYCNSHQPCRKLACAKGRCIIIDKGIVKCKCNEGFTGVHCNKPCITEKGNMCDKTCQKPCLNGGRCVNDKCLCDDHHTGEQCEFCVCKNGGNCTVSDTGNIICHCPELYTGIFCEKWRCRNYCVNGGECINCHFNNQSIPECDNCQCPSGTAGIRCEELQRDVSPGPNISTILMIIIIVIIFIILVVFGVIYIKRRATPTQFKHKRIQENASEISNPLYMPEMDESDLQETHDSQKPLHFDDTYDTFHHDSSTNLLRKEDERHQLLREDASRVRFYGDGDAHSKITFA